MKHTLKNFWLLWLCLLLSIFVIKSVNAEDSTSNTVKIDLSWTVQHSSRLHTLNLWSDDVLTGALFVTDNRVKFTNGLIIGDSHIVSSIVPINGHAVIGWWKANTVANKAAVWWWQTNKANAEYAIVGGWQNNEAQAQNSVVVWGYSNKTQGQNSVVVGWQGNTAKEQNSVVIGWQGNEAKQNNLVLGQGSKWAQGSFSWSGSADTQNWLINATSWILVGTTTPIDWVNLVVNGAVRIAWTNGTSRFKWEIRYVGKCFYAYDGSNWFMLNRWNDSVCTDFTIAKSCRFGNTVIQHGDVATGYSMQFGTDDTCDTDYKKTLECKGDGHLYIQGTSTLADSYYPYCYYIHN